MIELSFRIKLNDRLDDNAKNIGYFLKCNFCNGKATYIGQNTDLQSRMNSSAYQA